MCSLVSNRWCHYLTHPNFSKTPDGTLAADHVMSLWALRSDMFFCAECKNPTSRPSAGARDFWLAKSLSAHLPPNQGNWAEEKLVPVAINRVPQLGDDL